MKQRRIRSSWLMLPAPWPSTSCTPTSRQCRATCSSLPSSTEQITSGSSPGWFSSLGTGLGFFRHLPVPMGLERPAGGSGLPGVDQQGGGPHRGSPQHGRHLPAAPRRGRVHLEDLPHGGVLRSPAVLHPGSARRVDQGLRLPTMHASDVISPTFNPAFAGYEVRNWRQYVR